MMAAITRNNVDIFEAYRSRTGDQGAKSLSKPAGEGKAELQLQLVHSSASESIASGADTKDLEWTVLVR